MIDQIPADMHRRFRWMDLVKGEKLRMLALTNTLRYGMLVNISPTRRYRCDACEVTFQTVAIAKEHRCPYEVEFREVTHRTKEVFTQRQGDGEKAYSERPRPVMTDREKGTYIMDTELNNCALTAEVESLNELVEELQGKLKVNAQELETSERSLTDLRAGIQRSISAKIQRDNDEPYRKGCH